MAIHALPACPVVAQDVAACDGPDVVGVEPAHRSDALMGPALDGRGARAVPSIDASSAGADPRRIGPVHVDHSCEVGRPRKRPAPLIGRTPPADRRRSAIRDDIGQRVGRAVGPSVCHVARLGVRVGRRRWRWRRARGDGQRNQRESSRGAAQHRCHSGSSFQDSFDA